MITAGLPRKPGMSRDDLVKTNEAIVAEVTREVAKRSKNAVLVIVSNPLDAMCHVAKAVSSFPRERVVGMAGVLDTARFECFIAQETGLSLKEVTAMVLGGHGDQMVPVVSATTVGGIPLDQLVSKPKIRKMVERTKVGGGELVKLLGTSAWYAPGAAAAQMVDAICLDEKRVLPATAYLEGEYGIGGLYMGVPVKLGAGGAEEVVKLKLTAEREEDAEGLRGGGARRRLGADANKNNGEGVSPLLCWETPPHRFIGVRARGHRSTRARPTFRRLAEARRHAPPDREALRPARRATRPRCRRGRFPRCPRGRCRREARSRSAASSCPA